MEEKIELTPREWEVLRLVNEKIQVSSETLAHLIHGRQTATPRIVGILLELWSKGLVKQGSKVNEYKWTATEEGENLLENQPRPVKPFAL
jgi:predicted transcriptional regulator